MKDKSLLNKISIFIFPLWCSIIFVSSSVNSHQGEPSHGGDLPVDLGGNRLQYEGRANLVDIGIENSKFFPENITIDIGGMVAFENRDNIEHRILFKTGEADDQEEHDHPVMDHEITYVVTPEKYWVLEFLVPGLFPFECTIHGETGEVYVRY
jgi:plastocyanin